MWFQFAIISAAFFSIRRIFEKPLAAKLPYLTLGWTDRLLAIPLLVIFFLIAPRPATLITDPVRFWIPLIIIWIVLYPVQTYTSLRALHEGHLSEVVPILALVPVFIAFLSSILNHEILSFAGWVGVLLTVLGVMMLNSHNFKSFTHFKNNKAVWLMLIASVCMATGLTLDKIAISVSTPQLYALLNVTGATIVLFFTAQKVHADKSLVTVKSNKRYLLALGVCSSLAYITYASALQTGVTSYVIAIRNLSVIFSAVLGFFFFHEQFNRKKLISLSFISCGILVIGVFA